MLSSSEAGTYIFRPEAFLKNICESPFGGVVGLQYTLLRLEQLWNTPHAIEVTLSGILILVRLEQELNAETPIEVTPSGMVILVRLEQPLNALFPIEVTLSGMVILVRLE